ncbi:hypothetical protein L9F63_011780, partial [Diploptera punctata]
VTVPNVEQSATMSCCISQTAGLVNTSPSNIHNESLVRAPVFAITGSNRLIGLHSAKRNQATSLQMAASIKGCRTFLAKRRRTSSFKTTTNSKKIFNKVKILLRYLSRCDSKIVGRLWRKRRENFKIQDQDQKPRNYSTRSKIILRYLSRCGRMAKPLRIDVSDVSGENNIGFHYICYQNNILHREGEKVSYFSCIGMFTIGL